MLYNQFLSIPLLFLLWSKSWATDSINVNYTLSWQPNQNAEYDTMLVIYDGTTKQDQNNNNLQHFIHFGGINCSNHDTAIVLPPPLYEDYYSSILQPLQEQCLVQGHFVFVFLQEETTTTFAAMHLAMQHVPISLYRSMIVTHAGMVGPFQPYWTKTLTSKLCCGVIFVSLSGHCGTPPHDEGPWQPQRPYLQPTVYTINIQDGIRYVHNVLNETAKVNNDIAFMQQLSSTILLHGFGIHSVLQNQTLWKRNLQDECTMKDIWTRQGWVDQFGSATQVETTTLEIKSPFVQTSQWSLQEFGYNFVEGNYEEETPEL